MSLSYNVPVAFSQIRLSITDSSVFNLPATPLAGSLMLHLNGLFLSPGVDYTLAGSTVTLLDRSVVASDVLSAHYLAA
jgi:hypothetical protein